MTAPTPGALTVVALGGNALLRRGDAGTVQDQQRRAMEASNAIAHLVSRNEQVVVTHGNGPVVGHIFLRHEQCARLVPPMPLDVCGAESQGNIGYLLSNALENTLAATAGAGPVVTVLTRVVVSAEDEAFAHPTKPIGGFLSEEEAHRCPYPVARDADRGYRRIVPSPRPQHILELPAVRALLGAGAIPIAAGGGGVPVVRRNDGSLLGVEAVIDKDLAASLLGRELHAGTLAILTDIDRVYADFLSESRRPLPRLTVSEAERYLAEGHFLPGSMQPKIEAAVEFLRGGGRRVVICLPEQFAAALQGEAGTMLTAG